MGRPIVALDEKVIPAIDGHNVVLNIDNYMQYTVEKALYKAFKKYKAKGASCVVMDPMTGEVLAMVSLPNFDPNNIAVMYFFLNRIPKCRETLNEIDPEYIVCTQNSNGDYQSITIRAGNNDRVYPWQRIVDPWGNALMYDYYVNQNEDNSLSYDEMQETLRNFPLVTSAGPDGIFNTDDDIYNRIETRSTEYKP